MIKYIIVGIAFLVLFIIIILFIINSKKLKELLLKIDNAEENINLILTEKYTIISKLNKFIKSQNDEEVFKDLYDTNIEELSSIELNNKLATYDNIILELSEYNKDLEYNDETIKDFEKMNKNNINRLATEKYYNDNVVIYNELIDKFPANIIERFKGLDEKELFSNKKEEMFEILKK